MFEMIFWFFLWQFEFDKLDGLWKNQGKIKVRRKLAKKKQEKRKKFDPKNIFLIKFLRFIKKIFLGSIFHLKFTRFLIFFFLNEKALKLKELAWKAKLVPCCLVLWFSGVEKNVGKIKAISWNFFVSRKIGFSNIQKKNFHSNILWWIKLNSTFPPLRCRAEMTSPLRIFQENWQDLNRKFKFISSFIERSQMTSFKFYFLKSFWKKYEITAWICVQFRKFLRNLLFNLCRHQKISREFYKFKLWISHIMMTQFPNEP